MVARRSQLVARRRVLGLTQEALAARCGAARTTVARWETGEIVPGLWVRPTLAEVLQVPMEDLDALLLPDGVLATPPVAGVGAFDHEWERSMSEAIEMWQQDLQRRQFLAGVAFSAAAFLVPALRSLTSPPAPAPAGTGARAVEMHDVEAVTQMTTAFRHQDNRYGGGHVREQVIAYLNHDVAPMLTGRYDPTTGAALLGAAAQVTQLAAWTSYDVGRHATAQQYMSQALRMATAAGDKAMCAEILAAMSHQAAYLKQPVEAIDLARASAQSAASVGVGALQAEAAVLEAQGHALAGDEAACAASLDMAERRFDKAENTAAPQWLGYFDEAYLAAKFGHCFAALGRGDLAVKFAQRSLDMDDRYARGRQFNLALLARAHEQAGDVEQAAAVGQETISAARGLKSQRARDYLTDVAARLAPHAGLVLVDDFTERLRAGA
jgi:DNA-binding XRE family transcriptional regulator